MTNVVLLHQSYDPDNVLEAGKGVFDDVVVIGIKDGAIDIRATSSLEDSDVVAAISRANALLLRMIEDAVAHKNGED